jgi:hypothetical protein
MLQIARCRPGALKECGEFQEVYIALLFMGIDSEDQVDPNDNLGGLGLKETRLVVSPSMETLATFVVG